MVSESAKLYECTEIMTISRVTNCTDELDELDEFYLVPVVEGLHHLGICKTAHILQNVIRLQQGTSSESKLVLHCSSCMFRIRSGFRGNIGVVSLSGYCNAAIGCLPQR